MSTIESWVAKRMIPFVPITKKLFRFSVSALNNWIDSQAVWPEGMSQLCQKEDDQSSVSGQSASKDGVGKSCAEENRTTSKSAKPSTRKKKPNSGSSNKSQDDGNVINLKEPWNK